MTSLFYNYILKVFYFKEIAIKEERLKDKEMEGSKEGRKEGK